MKKFIFIILGALSALSATAREFSYTYENQKVFYTVVDEAAKTCQTKAGDFSSSSSHWGLKGDLVIPETVSDGNNEYTVVAIGQFSFYRCDYLTSIALPNSLRSINNSAFRESLGLTSINIPSSVTYIGALAFYHCTKLTSLYIPDSVTEIGECAFMSCSSLSSINIPNSISKLNQSVFNGCPALTSIDIPNSITTIGDYVFAGCKGLISIDIPISVASIGDKAFESCTALQSVSVPTNTPSLNRTAFNGIYETCELIIPDCSFDNYLCTAWSLFKNIKGKDFGVSFIAYSDDDFTYTLDPTSHTAIVSGLANTKLRDVVIPGSITYGANFDNPETYYITGVGYEAVYNSSISSVSFDSCNRLTHIGDFAFSNTKSKSLVLPATVTNIGKNAFEYCNRLTEIIIPPSVVSIGEAAFKKSSALTTVIMGSKITAIGDNTFDGCPVNTIYITAQTPPAASGNVFSYYNGDLYVQGEQSVEAYANAWNCWDSFVGQEMVAATNLEIDFDKDFTASPSATLKLNAIMTPANASLPYVFWRSTNPEIATVTSDGLVTIHDDMAEAVECKIIGETLYYNGPVVAYNVVDNSTSNLINIVADPDKNYIDYNLPIEVFNLNGMMVGKSIDNLTNGIYIVRQGKVVKKIAIK